MSAPAADAVMAGDAMARLLDGSGNDRRVEWDAIAGLGLGEVELEPGEGGLDYLFALMHELGRRASAQPVLEAIVARHCFPAHKTEGKRIAVALEDDDTGLRRGEREGLHGKLHFVEGAAEADLLVVLAPGGDAFAIDPGGEGVAIARAPALLPGLAQVTLNGAAALTLDMHGTRETALALIRFGLACRALGAAQEGFDLVIDHARTRKQFGRTIGSFQAIQHKLADSHIALTACREQLLAIAREHDRGGDWHEATSAAAVLAGHVLRKVALATQHCFGAIGYAEEHAAPALFRRIHGDLARLGILGSLRLELGGALLDGGGEALSALFAEGDATDTGFRHRLREWLAENWTQAHADNLASRPFAERNWDMAFMRRAGRDGWTTLTWPKAAGGMAASPVQQLIFAEEMNRAAAPDHPLICPSKILAPAVIAHGSDALREQLLPGLRSGEVTCCLGYSEPGAGSDLAGLRTRAVRDGEDYVVEGQKCWTTDGHRASHMILAARTDPDPARRQRGISLFVLPMDTPGIAVRPMTAMYGHAFCDVFFDNVRIPAAWRLGKENAGWPILAEALANERISMGGLVSQIADLFSDMLDELRNRGLARDSRTQERVALLAAEIVAARRLVIASLCTMPDADGALVAAAMTKIYAAELAQRLAETGLELLGTSALLGAGAPGAPIAGRIEQMLRTSIMYVVGGGSNEIQRTLVARRGLGLG